MGNNTIGETPSFKNVLLKPYATSQHSSQDMEMEEDEHNLDQDDNENDSHIILTTEEKRRIYMPWNFSVIIKIFGKKLSHIYFRKKLSLFGDSRRRLH